MNENRDVSEDILASFKILYLSVSVVHLKMRHHKSKLGSFRQTAQNFSSKRALDTSETDLSSITRLTPKIKRV